PRSTMPNGPTRPWSKSNSPSLRDFQGDSNINSKRLMTRISGGWEPETDLIETDGAPPVVVYTNPGGAGVFETHIDLINRINSGVLQRLSTMAMQAFRQRALKKEGDKPLPAVDDKGNAIDYAAIFEPAPGALWDLPPGVDIWESATTDASPMLAASKEDIRHLSAATKTPLPMLMPDGANQTAEGAMNTEKGFIFKCEACLAVVKLGLEAIIVKALETEGVADVGNVEVSFEAPARVTLSEKYSAAAQAAAAGEPWGSIARNILKYSPDQIAQVEKDRAKEEAMAPQVAPPAPQDFPQ
ncbi:hypothetical protein ACM0CH_21425, partial [Mycobacteroides abscessus subsp. abscessus]